MKKSRFTLIEGCVVAAIAAILIGTVIAVGAIAWAGCGVVNTIDDEGLNPTIDRIMDGPKGKPEGPKDEKGDDQ